MPAPDPTTANKHAFRLVALLVAFTFVGHFNRISISVAGAEKIIPDQLIDKESMGWVYFAFLLVYTACMIPGGWAIDRFGGRTALAVMGICTAALVATTGLAGMLVPAALLLPALLVIRGLLGLVSVPLHPGCANVIADSIPARMRTTANGAVTAAALLGIACTYYGFGWLMDRFGWPLAFVICGAVTAGLALLWIVDGLLRRNETSLSPAGAMHAAMFPAIGSSRARRSRMKSARKPSGSSGRWTWRSRR